MLALTGCGGADSTTEAPPLPQALAGDLAARSDAVAERLDGGDVCGARAEAEELQRLTIAAVNGGRVPPRYQEELTAAVGALLSSIACVEAPAAPPPAEPTDDDGEVEEDEPAEKQDDEEQPEEHEHDDDDEKDEKEEKGKQGKGKGKGKKGKGRG